MLTRPVVFGQGDQLIASRDVGALGLLYQGHRLEWDCLGQSTQQWNPFPWPGDPGAVGIYNLKAHDCLDVFRNGTGNGVWADIWPCKQSDNENQKWTLQYLGYSLSTG
jgi:hypothetical protein